MLLDSALNSQLPARQRGRQWPHSRPSRPRLKKRPFPARFEAPSSSTLPQPRQTCNSGSHPESRTAHSEKYVTARHIPPASPAAG